MNDANGARPISAGGTGGTSAETARTGLEVARKQDSTYDRTAGRGLIVGAGGWLGNAGEWLVADGNLADIVPTSLRRVASANAVGMGGPAAVDALVRTWRYDGSNAHQEFLPIGGATPWPWRRRQVAGTWGNWIRDFDHGTETTGRWERRASGWQTCTISSVTFDYVATDRLGYTWTFPKAFVTAPNISFSISTSTADATGILPGDIGALGRTEGLTSSIIRLWRVRGAPDFEAGDKIENVSLTATGRWLDI